MKKKWLLLAVCIAFPLLVGVVAALLTRSGMELYDTVIKPPLSPTAWLFPVIWTILYVLMGTASYLVLTSEKLRTNALYAYIVQLALNFVWPILFFDLEMYLLAFFVLVGLWIAVLVTTVRFYRIRPAAGILMIPYLVWLTFAGYLNLAVVFLNP